MTNSQPEMDAAGRDIKCTLYTADTVLSELLSECVPLASLLCCVLRAFCRNIMFILYRAYAVSSYLSECVPHTLFWHHNYTVALNSSVQSGQIQKNGVAISNKAEIFAYYWYGHI